jgi:hypothetical protein
MTSASSAVKSWQKLSWNFFGLIQTKPSLSGAALNARGGGG